MPSSIKTSSLSLSNALAEHVSKEKASFHIPGHKGYAWQTEGSLLAEPSLKYDLTELPGLDELAYPSGIIADLETRAAETWGAHSTLLSVSGATAGNMASILMLAERGTHVLIPRNCHRSVLHGLILSGLSPIWFDPQWDSEWRIWGAPDPTQLSALLKDTFAKEQNATKQKHKIAGLFVTGPTYAGALTDVQALSDLCDTYKIPLVVDEAWGAHLYWTDQSKQAALNAGASLVVHSLHKTLSCPTQTGLVHISKKGAAEFGFSQYKLRACMSLIQSSSPSYLFMEAIDSQVSALSAGKAQEQLHKTEKLGARIKDFITKTANLSLYASPSGNTFTHFMIKHKDYDPIKLQALLIEKGIFPELPTAQGLIFILGIGSQSTDIDKLEMALKEITALPHKESNTSSSNNNLVPQSLRSKKSANKPQSVDQALSPREAFFLPSHVVPVEQAVGKISAECLAPCPPGWTLLVPGQRITEEILSFENIKFVRILESNS